MSLHNVAPQIFINKEKQSMINRSKAGAIMKSCSSWVRDFLSVHNFVENEAI